MLAAGPLVGTDPVIIASIPGAFIIVNTLLNAWITRKTHRIEKRVRNVENITERRSKRLPVDRDRRHDADS